MKLFQCHKVLYHN